MTATLTINGRRVELVPETSIFDAAARAGVRVPTSCVTQGKCRECIVEVTRGMADLSPRTTPEQHLTDPFRLACQARLASAIGEIVCHTMRRGRLRIENHALDLPVGRAPLALDPAVTRDGAWVLIDGEPVERASGPLHGIAMDLGTTTIVLRLLDLESGDVVADASFENPQRFGGSDVMSRIHYDTHHPGRLLMRTVAGYLTHAIEEFPVDPQHHLRGGHRRQLHDARPVLPAERVLDRPEPVPLDHRDRDGRGQADDDEPHADGADGRCCPFTRRPGSTAARSSAATSERMPLPACWRSTWPTRTGSVAIMDIGTNTELILGNRHRILAASCPAGPAFEGGAIRCGMPGLDGRHRVGRARRRRHVPRWA